jgi:uncharacterized RDD family membrane protein YckC
VSEQQWQPPGDWDLGSWEERLQGSAPTADGTVTAEWWRRVIALLLDNLLLYAVSALVGLQATSSTAVANLRVVAELALTFCYFGYLNGVIGQTVGKRVMHIRCVDAETGEPIGFRRGLARYAVVALLGLAFIVPAFIDGLWPLWDDRRQTWHDKAVRSLVVNAR